MESSKQEMELLYPVRASHQKTYLTKEFSFNLSFPKHVWKQDMEFSKQEMELFLSLLGL